jgi:hypothetical protein
MFKIITKQSQINEFICDRCMIHVTTTNTLAPAGWIFVGVSWVDNNEYSNEMHFCSSKCAKEYMKEFNYEQTSRADN